MGLVMLNVNNQTTFNLPQMQLIYAATQHVCRAAALGPRFPRPRAGVTGADPRAPCAPRRGGTPLYRGCVAHNLSYNIGIVKSLLDFFIQLDYTVE